MTGRVWPPWKQTLFSPCYRCLFSEEGHIIRRISLVWDHRSCYRHSTRHFTQLFDGSTNPPFWIAILFFLIHSERTSEAGLGVAWTQIAENRIKCREACSDAFFFFKINGKGIAVKNKEISMRFELETETKKTVIPVSLLQIRCLNWAATIRPYI